LVLEYFCLKKEVPLVDSDSDTVEDFSFLFRKEVPPNISDLLQQGIRPDF